MKRETLLQRYTDDINEAAGLADLQIVINRFRKSSPKSVATLGTLGMERVNLLLDLKRFQLRKEFKKYIANRYTKVILDKVKEEQWHRAALYSRLLTLVMDGEYTKYEKLCKDTGIIPYEPSKKVRQSWQTPKRY